jgi:two-component sensor histidine kinase
MKFKIVLIVDELNNNAIEYGSKPEDHNIMRLDIKKDSNYYYINIEVEDS